MIKCAIPHIPWGNLKVGKKWMTNLDLPRPTDPDYDKKLAQCLGILKNSYIGSPKPTEKYTAAQMESWGLFGVYEEPPDGAF